jgi:2,5-diketo-D-gluconate reductase A
VPQQHDRYTVPLPGGRELPIVGFGTWQLRGGRAYEAVRYALAVGYRHIDTATMYGNEDEVGRALRDSMVPRAEVLLTTKLPPGRFGRERATITASLQALGSGYVDLWLIHWPPRDRSTPAIWREFLAARDDGLARAVGVSNFSLGQIDALTAASGEAPAVNQIPWSPADHDPAVLRGHRQRGIVLEGYSPLRRTNLRHPVLVDIAGRHGVSPAQVVLRWHIEHGIVVIPKSGTPERIKANIEVFTFSLTDDEVRAIDALGQR